MHNFQLVLQEPQSLDHTPRYSTQYIFRYITTRNLFQRPCIHILHAIINTTLDEERAVKVDDVWRGRSMKNIQLGNDSLEFRIIQFKSNFLLRVVSSDLRRGATRD